MLKSHLSGFDKVCAVLAFLIGTVFVVLGVLGLFAGCSANFTLPPIIGVVPAFVGWGIVKPVMIAWKQKREPSVANLNTEGTIDHDVPCANCAYNLRYMKPTGFCPECGTPVSQSAERFEQYGPTQ